MPRLTNAQTVTLPFAAASVVVRAEADNIGVTVPGLNDGYPDVLMNTQSQVYRLGYNGIKTIVVTGTGNFVWSIVARHPATKN